MNIKKLQWQDNTTTGVHNQYYYAKEHNRYRLYVSDILGKVRTLMCDFDDVDELKQFVQLHFESQVKDLFISCQQSNN